MIIKNLKKHSTKNILNKDIVKNLKSGKNETSGLYEINFLIDGKEMSFKDKTQHITEKKFSRWGEKIHHTVNLFEAPDGTVGTVSFFKKEVQYGILHDCIVSF